MVLIERLFVTCRTKACRDLDALWIIEARDHRRIDRRYVGQPFLRGDIRIVGFAFAKLAISQILDA